MSLAIDPSTLSPSGWWKADVLSGADGSPVASWTDSSGNGRHLTQATDGLKPRLRRFQDATKPNSANGDHVSVRFDGTDDYLQSGVNLSTFLGANGLGTIIAVVRFQKNVFASAAAYGVLGVNAATGTKLSLRYDLSPEKFEAQNNDGAPDTAQIFVPRDTALSAIVAGQFATQIAPATRILVWRHDTTVGEVQLAVDNLDDVAFAKTASGSTSDLANALLLGRSFEHYWLGDIFEVIAFPTAISESNMRGLGLYLTEKYGLPYESGIAATEDNPEASMLVEMMLPSTELALEPTLHLKADAIVGLADSDPVATWPDSSGNGYDVAQGTAADRPLYKTNILNGRPAVLFDGSSDYLASSALLSSILAGGGVGTLYVVARADSPGGDPDQTLWRDSGGTVHLTVVEAGTDVLRASNDDGVQDTVTKAYTMGSWMVGMWRHTPDERVAEAPNEIYVGVNSLDSVDISGVSSGSTTAAILGNVFEIGRGSGFLNGYIAELLIFPKAHTQSERRHVRSYLAAKYGLSYPSDYEAVWVNVTSDVRNARGLTFGRGMDGPDAQDRVAASGTLQLVLENSAENSAGIVGYYSPENASVRPGFRCGTPVRVAFRYYGTTYYKWHGHAINIRVVPGELSEREVTVTAADWMDYAARVTLSGLPIEVSKRADELMATLYVVSPRQPESISFYKGSDVYAYGLDNTEDEGVLILSELHRLAISELGYIYIRGDTVGGGRLVFESRAVRTGSPIRWAMGETELEVKGLELSEHSLDGIINRVMIELHPRRVDAAATSVLFSLGSAQAVGSTPVTFTAPYRDPVGGRSVRVGGTAMVTPVATTDYLVNSLASGAGTNLTANYTVSAVFGGNSAKITVTKNSGADGYLTKCQLRGKGVYAFESVMVDISDATSMTNHGQMMQRIDMAYQSDLTLAKTVADLLLANNKDPRTKVRKVKFTGNWSSAHMMHALARDVGDRISISESVSGLAAEEYFIQSVAFKVTASTVIEADWLLVPAGQETY